QSGAVVPGALVAVQNLKTGVKQSAETNNTGLYGFPVLPPGSYSLTATLKGFRDVQCMVQVLVGNTASQDIRLQVGAGGDRVSVSGTPPLLRPTESSASTVMQRSFIDELPLNGRRYTDFTLLAPNTSSDGDTGLVSVAGQQGGEDSGYANGNGSNSSPWTAPTPPATTSPTFWAGTASRTYMGRTPSRSFKSRSARTPPSMEVVQASSIR